MALAAPTVQTGALGGVWASRSARERKLLAGLGLVLLVAAPFWTFTQAMEARSNNAEARSELDAARNQANRALGGTAARMEQARSEVLGWAYEAPTPTVGQVLAQRQLLQLAASAGLSDVEVKASDRHEQAGEVTLAPLELSANFTWNGFSGLMNGLEATGRGFVIDTVQLSEDDSPKLRLGLRVPVVTRDGDSA